jgi:hypothetical protein
MDNTEAKTTAEQKPGKAGAIIFFIVLLCGVAFLVYRWNEQRKIDSAMKKVRQAKADRNAIDNVGSAE